jgi:hypothetical protein
MAGDQVEKGGLPGAIGADDRTEFPFLNGEAHPIDRQKPIEGFLHLFNG